MATRRKKNQFTGFLVILGALILGAFQAEKIKELIEKVTGKGGTS